MASRPRPHRPGPRPGPPAPREPQSPREPRDHGETIQGLRAGLAVFEARPDDVLRVAYARPVRSEVATLERWAASRRVPCAEVPEAELDRIAQGSHHEGLCVLARFRRYLGPGELADLLARTRGTCVALDRVRNPYNIGAVLRSAAFFGVDAALLGAPAPHPGLAPTAVRVAEGGAERVAVARTTDLADTLARLRARGARVVGTDGHATDDALSHRFERPAILVLGNEREGLADRVRAQCDAIVAIRGSGHVESLNVAVAAGVLVAAMTRRA